MNPMDLLVVRQRPLRSSARHARGFIGLAQCVVLAVLVGCASNGTAPARTSWTLGPPPLVVPVPPGAPSVRADVADNGARIVRVPASDSTFRAGLFVSASPWTTPRELQGIEAFWVDAATLATEGDPDRTTRPHQRALLLGGELTAYSDGQLLGWVVAGPRTEAGRLIQLLSDVATRPTFPATRVQALAERERERIEHAADRPHRRGRALAIGAALNEDRALWSATAPRTLASVQRDDLARLQRRLVSPERATLVVAGDVDREQLRPLTDWRSEPVELGVQTRCVRPKAAGRYLSANKDRASLWLARKAPSRLQQPARRAWEQVLTHARWRGLQTLRDNGLRVEFVEFGNEAVLLVTAKGPTWQASELADKLLAILGSTHGGTPPTRDASWLKRHNEPLAQAAISAIENPRAPSSEDFERARRELGARDAWGWVGAGGVGISDALKRWGAAETWRPERLGCRSR